MSVDSSALVRGTVVVLSGGRSSEREVSTKTGAAIARALRQNLDGRGPLRVEEVEIQVDGSWRRNGEVHTAPELLARWPSSTLWFLGLHGGEGENGTIQGLLTACGHVHTGSGVMASALCMNKAATKVVLDAAGVAVAPGLEVHPLDFSVDPPGIVARARRLSTTGFAVKPNAGGSSVATTILEARCTDDELCAAIERGLATGDRVLVEQRLTGTEATCGVLGNERGELRALVPVEIVPKAGRFFDYEEKYSSLGATEYCPPRSISPHTVARLRELALRAHRAAACDGYSRTDFIVPCDAHGAEGEPVALEINTLPGMTDRSLLPQAAAATGLDFRGLCLEILRLAVEKDRGAR